MNEANPVADYEIKATGRIVGVSKVVVIRDDQPKPTYWLTQMYLGFSLVELVIAAFIALAIFGLVIRVLRQRRPDIWSSKGLEFYLLVLAAGTAITAFWTEQVVYEVLIRGRARVLLVNYAVFFLGGALLVAVFVVYAWAFLFRPPRSKGKPAER